MMTIISFSLCVIYTIYLLLGGFMFTYLEYEVTQEIITSAQPAWIRLKEISVDTLESEEEIVNLIEWLHKECSLLSSNLSSPLLTVGNHSVIHHEIEANCSFLTSSVVSVSYDYPWSLIDAIYFSMTVITTIGFGHISPTTTEGKIACIFYSLIGIPLTLVLLARTSTFFGKRLYELFTSKVNTEKQRSKVFISIGAFLYLVIGLFIFMLLPAILFMYIEDWTYLDSVYFAYITLTTIGFGDLVTGRNMKNPWLIVYQIGVILWIIAGLGYWLMVANFMVLAFRSKKVHVMARKMTELKRVVSQLNVNQREPEFIIKSSKTSLNFLMQFASALAVPKMEQGSVTLQTDSSTSNSPKPAMNRPTLPGIAALFNQPIGGGMPLFQQVVETEKKADNEKNKSTSSRNI